MSLITVFQVALKSGWVGEKPPSGGEMGNFTRGGFYLFSVGEHLRRNAFETFLKLKNFIL